jgi:hypothetical protein
MDFPNIGIGFSRKFDFVVLVEFFQVYTSTDSMLVAEQGYEDNNGKRYAK